MNEDKRSRAWLADYRKRGGTGREELVTPEQIEQAHGSTCILCGDPDTELGHVVSVKNGGDHTLDNVRPLCLACNRKIGGKNLTLPDAEHVEHEVTGEELADAGLSYILGHTSLDQGAARVCVLYGMATWISESFVYFPRLVINSTVHGVGKSVASKTVGALAANEKDCDAGSPTPAALRRMLARREDRRPTFLVDELQKTDNEFRAVLNAGFERDAVIPIELLSRPVDDVRYESFSAMSSTS